MGVAKRYCLISPAGEKVSVFNMKEFCKENGVREASMSELTTGKIREHKGWRIDGHNELFNLFMNA